MSVRALWGRVLTTGKSLLRQTIEHRQIPPHVRQLARLQIDAGAAHLGRSVRKRGRGPGYARARRAASGQATVVHAEGGWQAAVPADLLSVRDMAHANLGAVADLLSAGRVDFFVRDPDGPGGVTIGIDALHRGAALKALARAEPDARLYAQSGAGSGPVPLRSVGHSPSVARATRLLVYRPYRLDDHHVIGAAQACEIQFWQHGGENLRPPRGAAPARIVLAESTPAEMTVGDRTYPTLSPFADHRALAEPSFPVDAVYTWVDDTDPAWRASLDETRARFGLVPLHAQSANPSRYRNRDELRYSLRSLALYAPFIRTIYIVTAGQTPAWLADHPKVRIVDHSEILAPDCLPTFNSHSIESSLHHIEGLAEHYLYLNDDFLIGREVTATTFFTPNGLPRFFPDENAPVPAGPPTEADRPVDSASKNVRDLMLGTFGARVARKMLHVPYAQRRSVLEEMEQRFPAEFDRTAHSRFRQATDFNVASNLSHYYAFLTGRAVEGLIESSYIDISKRPAPLELRRLVDRRDRDVVCINDTDVPPDQTVRLDNLVAGFLEAFLPVPSPFERAVDAQEPARTNDTMSVNP